MITAKTMISALRFFIFGVAWPASILMYPAMAHAQPIVFGQGFLLIPALAWMAVLFLSTLAGVAALLLRISARLDSMEKGIEPIQRKNMLIFAAAHMFGSWVAGLFVFLSSLYMGHAEWLVGISILAGSFGGAKTLEVAADALYKKKFLSDKP